MRAESSIFFHMSAVKDAVFETLTEGQRVEFTVEASPKARVPVRSV